MARLGIALIMLTRHWPQRRRTRLAHVLADIAWSLPRARRVTLINLRACFPELSEAERRQIGRATFRSLTRAALDHSILASADLETFRSYVRVDGEHHILDPANRPLIIVAPHFAGLNAGGMRSGLITRGASIYSRQKNPVWNDWLLQTRLRFADPILIPRQDIDMRNVVRIMKSGIPLYYLPDTDLGRTSSIFVPFFGIDAATIPMVSRLARLTGAKVLTAVTEMTDDGYVLHVEAPWADFPGASVEEDTARMNREVERWVRRLPTQYFWTHKRFRTRPRPEDRFY